MIQPISSQVIQFNARSLDVQLVKSPSILGRLITWITSCGKTTYVHPDELNKIRGIIKKIDNKSVSARGLRRLFKIQPKRSALSPTELRVSKIEALARVIQYVAVTSTTESQKKIAEEPGIDLSKRVTPESLGEFLDTILQKKGIQKQKIGLIQEIYTSLKATLMDEDDISKYLEIINSKMKEHCSELQIKSLSSLISFFDDLDSFDLAKVLNISIETLSKDTEVYKQIAKEDCKKHIEIIKHEFSKQSIDQKKITDALVKAHKTFSKRYHSLASDLQKSYYTAIAAECESLLSRAKTQDEFNKILEHICQAALLSGVSFLSILKNPQDGIIKIDLEKCSDKFAEKARLHVQQFLNDTIMTPLATEFIAAIEKTAQDVSSQKKSVDSELCHIGNRFTHLKTDIEALVGSSGNIFYINGEFDTENTSNSTQKVILEAARDGRLLRARQTLTEPSEEISIHGKIVPRDQRKNTVNMINEKTKEKDLSFASSLRNANGVDKTFSRAVPHINFPNKHTYTSSFDISKQVDSFNNTVILASALEKEYTKVNPHVDPLIVRDMICEFLSGAVIENTLVQALFVDPQNLIMMQPFVISKNNTDSPSRIEISTDRISIYRSYICELIPPPSEDELSQKNMPYIMEERITCFRDIDGSIQLESEIIVNVDVHKRAERLFETVQKNISSFQSTQNSAAHLKQAMELKNELDAIFTPPAVQALYEKARGGDTSARQTIKNFIQTRVLLSKVIHAEGRYPLHPNHYKGDLQNIAETAECLASIISYEGMKDKEFVQAIIEQTDIVDDVKAIEKNKKYQTIIFKTESDPQKTYKEIVGSQFLNTDETLNEEKIREQFKIDADDRMLGKDRKVFLQQKEVDKSSLKSYTEMGLSTAEAIEEELKKYILDKDFLLKVLVFLQQGSHGNEETLARAMYTNISNPSAPFLIDSKDAKSAMTIDIDPTGKEVTIKQSVARHIGYIYEDVGELSQIGSVEIETSYVLTKDGKRDSVLTQAKLL